MQPGPIYNSSQFRTFVSILIKQQMMYFLASFQFKLGICICMHYKHKPFHEVKQTTGVICLSHSVQQERKSCSDFRVKTHLDA